MVDRTRRPAVGWRRSGTDDERCADDHHDDRTAPSRSQATASAGLDDPRAAADRTNLIVISVGVAVVVDARAANAASSRSSSQSPGPPLVSSTFLARNRDGERPPGREQSRFRRPDRDREISASSARVRPSRWWRTRIDAAPPGASAAPDPNGRVVSASTSTCDASDATVDAGTSRTRRREFARITWRAALTTIRWSQASNRSGSRRPRSWRHTPTSASCAASRASASLPRIANESRYTASFRAWTISSNASRSPLARSIVDRSIAGPMRGPPSRPSIRCRSSPGVTDERRHAMVTCRTRTTRFGLTHGPRNAPSTPDRRVDFLTGRQSGGAA